MSVQLETNGPRFVPPYRLNKSGVDFLGMRQVNLDMMINCLPGFNNATWYVRPFSVVSWIYWKFHQLSERRGSRKVTTEELKVWKEKVETLFTWGHKLEDVGGIPGTDAKAPGPRAVPLNFAAWNRSSLNTSLMAAVQYGPAAKTIDGFGFLEPLGQGFFQTVNDGVALAEALDTELRGFTLLNELGAATAAPEDASELYSAWTILEPSEREQEAFRRSFFNPDTVGEQTPLGRRSTTVRLAIEALESARKPLTADEVRVHMFRGLDGSKRTDSVDPRLKRMWLCWVVLQIRQCQRLGMEGLLSWLERQLELGYRDTDAVVKQTLKAIKAHEELFPLQSPIRALNLLQEQLPSFNEALRQTEVEPALDPFRLMEETRKAILNKSESTAPFCLRSLFLCAALALLLRSEASVKAELERGASDRVSLNFWADNLLRWGSSGLEEFLRHFFESLILSQHFAVAARRFDGQRQRLRISIEEDGLEFLAAPPFVPSVTPDRLYTALSLMADCGLIGWDDAQDGYIAR
ncbi:MAG TPA: hypothetical protein VF297_22465 [Pyrinomonadaceae bacterium]